jgi:hypothetical protein
MSSNPTLLSQRRLFEDPGFCTLSFSPDYVVHTSIYKESLLSICDRSWLDGDSITFLQLTLARCYGQDDKTLVMPPLLEGENWSHGQDFLLTGAFTKMFAIVHMGNHWGVAYFDLQALPLLFETLCIWIHP